MLECVFLSVQEIDCVSFVFPLKTKLMCRRAQHTKCVERVVLFAERENCPTSVCAVCE